MEERALIGHTGFVGGFLLGALPPCAVFNSRNIEEIKGRSFETVYCAGISAVKWLANKEPEKDRAGIEKLQDCLSDVTARRFVHVSTVDVFKVPEGVDETSIVETEGLQPYGLHRYLFETFLRERFSDVLVLRLPALFGPGLRKNALYDLLHDNGLDRVPRRGVFQWYDLRRLPADLERAQGLSLVHLATEPLPILRIMEAFFPEKKNVGHDEPAARYDMRTIHAARFGGQGPYIESADAVLARMGNWIAQEKSRCP